MPLFYVAVVQRDLKGVAKRSCESFCRPGFERRVVVADSISFASSQARKLTHSVAPPLRKRPRSAHLFACKRAHDGSLSLPLFCGFLILLRTPYHSSPFIVFPTLLWYNHPVNPSPEVIL